MTTRNRSSRSSTFVGQKGAVSSILGGVLFIAVLLIGFGLIAWNGTVYDNYVQVVNSREQLYQQSVYENLVITGFKFSSQSNLNLTVTNVGPLTVQIVRIWVTDLSTNPPSHATYNVNYFVNPGRSLRNVGLTLGSFNPAHLYGIKLVTKRGNMVSTTSLQKNSLIGIAQTMGWITIIWDTYLYTDDNIYPTYRPGWNISGTGTSGRISFNITVVNHWIQNVTLLKYTYLRFEIDSGTTGTTFPYYIMAPGSTPKDPVCYTGTPSQPDDATNTPIVIPYNKAGDWPTGGTPIKLQFMDVAPYKGQCTVPSSNKPKAAHYYSVYLVVYYSYKVGTTWNTIAQTIPFEATGFQF